MKKRMCSFILAFLIIFSIVPNLALAAVPDDSVHTTVNGAAPVGRANNRIQLPFMAPDADTFISHESSDGMIDLGGSSEGVKRYTVLLLDTAEQRNLYPNGYPEPCITVGASLDKVKKASAKFVQQVLTAEGDNYVALIQFDSSAAIVSDFSDNAAALSSAIHGLQTGGAWLNSNQAFLLADELLDKVSDPSAIKNVLYFAGYLPADGVYSMDGHYGNSDYGWIRLDNFSYIYGYCNPAYDTAETLKGKGYNLYTLGCFTNLDQEPTSYQFTIRVMNDLQNSGFYDAQNPEDLDFVFGDIADSITQTQKTGTFHYASGSKQDYTSTYYYDDEYFYSNTYSYDEHLSTMSLCLALSAFGSNDTDSYTMKNKNARALLTGLGFSDFASNAGFQSKPGTDTIGAVAARKNIRKNGSNENYTLIAVAVRGGGYESEWASNLTLGTAGQHQGFREARENVLSFIQSYITDNGITGNIKLWITGYSRAAASNLTAAAIDDGSLKGLPVTLKPDDLYAYCFECPAGAIASDIIRDKPYTNIHNVINPVDPVPMVAPVDMGFDRYGEDFALPSKSNNKNYDSIAGGMKVKLAMLESIDEYVVDDFQMKKPHIDWLHVLPGGKPFVSAVDDRNNDATQDMFLSDFIKKLVKEVFINRSNYVSKYQKGIREVCRIFFGSSTEQSEKLVSVFTDKLKSNLVSILSAYVYPKGNDAQSLINKCLTESLDEAGIYDYDTKTVQRAAGNIVNLFLSTGVRHPKLTATLISNLSGIGQAHYPEICLAWLQSQDGNYNGTYTGFTSGDYRIIHINCPVDVEVASDGRLVGAIYSDIPQEGSIITSINEDGEKIAFLPANGSYTVKLTAKGDGNVSYSIQEYCARAGDNTRLINFYDIPVNMGDTLIGNVPVYNCLDLQGNTRDGSETAYNFSHNGQELTPDSDLRGTAATSAYYTVTATVDGADSGIVFGGGMYQEGEYAQLTAYPFQDAVFQGWYADGVLVSGEVVYRLRVTADTGITARFSTDNLYIKGVQGSVIEVYTFDGEKVLEAKDGTPVYEYLDDHKEYVVRVTMPLNFGYRVSYNGVTTTLSSTNELVISLSSGQRNEFIITAPDLE